MQLQETGEDEVSAHRWGVLKYMGGAGFRKEFHKGLQKQFCTISKIRSSFCICCFKGFARV